jgi:hypothetical protein
MPDDLEKLGHEAIAQAVASCGPAVIVIEMTRQLGDILHSTMVVRHYRATTKTDIVWAIGAKYVSAFEHFTPAELGPHAIAPLPDLPAWPEDGKYRIAWVYAAKKLPKVVSAFGCGVHPWGWKRGDIVSAVLENAGIEKLAVPRRPWLPVAVGDVKWADSFIASHTGARYIALEYCSYSLEGKPLAWFSDLVKRIQAPVVALGSSSDPVLPGAIDARGTTFQQAKAIIAKAKMFIGCGSGLSVVAAAHGCEQPVIELIDFPLSMAGIGYRRKDDRHMCMKNKTTAEVAARVNMIR